MKRVCKGAVRGDSTVSKAAERARGSSSSVVLEEIVFIEVGVGDCVCEREGDDMVLMLWR